jgi:hypothetical protein
MSYIATNNPSSSSVGTIGTYMDSGKIKKSLASGAIAGLGSQLLGNNSIMPYFLVGTGSAYIGEHFSSNVDNFIKTNTPIKNTHSLTKPIVVAGTALGAGYVLSGFSFPDPTSALVLTGLFAGSHWIGSKLF